jgi:hypothetical protein
LGSLVGVGDVCLVFCGLVFVLFVDVGCDVVGRWWVVVLFFVGVLNLLLLVVLVF